jgi:ferredoxin-NADP reductase
MLVHKLRKFDLVLAFGAAAAIVVAFTSLNPVSGVLTMLTHSSLFFFAFVMLTEPLTMPPTRTLRIIYGALVGVLFAPATHLGSLYFSPELALVVGNLFSYFASPKGRFMLSFVERRVLASGIYEYLFHSDRPFRYVPGQYLEWSLGAVPLDNRGNRRFFTIASAPEDAFVALGVRFYDKPSAFKRTLAELPVGAEISVASLAGDFTMPADKKKKLTFIAGGIGVTPFASMARHCIAAGESRDAVLLYSSKTAQEIAYQDVFSQAERVGWRTVYALSDEIPTQPGVQHGFIDANLVKQEVPDYAERTFYISGPPGMVGAMKKMLIGIGVSRLNIKTDFFPGLA